MTDFKNIITFLDYLNDFEKLTNFLLGKNKMNDITIEGIKLLQKKMFSNLLNLIDLIPEDERKELKEEINLLPISNQNNK